MKSPEEEQVVVMSSVRRWMPAIGLVSLVGLVSRVRADGRGDHATAVLDRETDSSESFEVDGVVTDGDESEWPTFDVAMLEPEDDEGGPTSYYSGEVTGITQVLQLMHSLAAGRDPKDSLRSVPREARVFDLDA